MQFNIFQTKEEVKIINLGFSGIIPNALDLTRFTSHATPDKSLFTFYINDYQIELFLTTYYKEINDNIDETTFRRDILLASLNEYIEFLETDEDETGNYYQRTIKIASAILNKKS